MIGMSMIGLNDNVESNHSELTYIYHLQTGRSLKERERQQPSVYNCCGRQRKKCRNPTYIDLCLFPACYPETHVVGGSSSRLCAPIIG